MKECVRCQRWMLGRAEEQYEAKFVMPRSGVPAPRQIKNKVRLDVELKTVC